MSAAAVQCVIVEVATKMEVLNLAGTGHSCSHSICNVNVFVSVLLLDYGKRNPGANIHCGVGWFFFLFCFLILLGREGQGLQKAAYCLGQYSSRHLALTVSSCDFTYCFHGLGR